MRVSRLWVLPGVACAAFMLSCESSPDSVAGLDDIPPVRFAPAKCEEDDRRGRCRGETGATESPKVVLSGNYETETEQDIIFGENGRTAMVRTEDGQQIKYKLDITLPFEAGKCNWSGVSDAEAGAFWDAFLSAPITKTDQFRHFLIRVNKKANGDADGEHRTEARWFVDDEKSPLGRVMYLVKAGTPGDLLENESLRSATGSFDDNGDGTKTLEITGGAVRLTKCNVTENAFGCGPKSEKVEVACLNPLGGMNAQVFTATVTTP